MELLKSIVTESRLASDDISVRRSSVREFVLAQSDQILSDDFDSIGRDDLELLFQSYDEHFFENQLADSFSHSSSREIQFRISKRMTTTGGMTTFQPARRHNADQYEIAISSNLLFSTQYHHAKPVIVCGVATSNRLDALQRIFEHELAHLLETMIWRRSSCAQYRFKSMVWRLFGHEESNHQLTTPAEAAKNRLGIETGDLVSFLYDGRKITGYVNGIHRRATVLVPHKKGQVYCDRKRYLKFYVPLGELQKM